MNNKELLAKDSFTTEKKLTWLHYIIPPCILSVLTALFYYPSLHYSFQFDDIANITKHFDIRHNTFKALFFTGTRWISYWLNAIHYSIGGFDPFSYRVGNVAIHTTNGILLFFVLLAMLRHVKKGTFFQRNAHPLSFLTALLFLLHPVQTQTVSYVIQGQLEGLALMATLSMTLCFLHAQRARTIFLKGILTSLLFLIALFACGTKEIAIIIPALLLLVDWFFVAQGRWETLKKRILLHVLLGLFLIGIYTWFLKPQFFTEILGLQKVARNNIGNVITENPSDPITPWIFFISQFKVILHYLWIFVWPFNISVEYDWVLSRGFLAPDSFLPFLGLLTLGFIIVRILQHNIISPLAFGALWFFACILPRSSIIPSPELLVDYKTYMASCGVLFVIAICLMQLANWLFQHIKTLNTMFADRGQGKIAFALALAIPLGLSTMQRNTIWRSGIDFWGNMIKNAPNKARAYNNYGVELSQTQRKFEESIPYFKKAISMDKNYPDPWNNLAVAYANLNKIDLAIEALKEGIKINPYYPEGYNNIASFYLQKKDLDRAEKALQTAIKLRPHYGKAHFNLGRVYLERGNTEKAWECFKTCCTKADFDVDHGFATYAQASFNLKKYDEAIAAYEKTLQLNPQYPGATFNLGNAYFMTQQYEKALAMYKKTLEQDPKSVQAAFNMGETYFTIENYQEALAWFAKLEPMKKQLPQIYIRQAQCHEKLGNTGQAKTLLTELINADAKPEDSIAHQAKEGARIMLTQLNAIHGKTTT